MAIAAMQAIIRMAKMIRANMCAKFFILFFLNAGLLSIRRKSDITFIGNSSDLQSVNFSISHSNIVGFYTPPVLSVFLLLSKMSDVSHFCNQIYSPITRNIIFCLVRCTGDRIRTCKRVSRLRLCSTRRCFPASTNSATPAFNYLKNFFIHITNTLYISLYLSSFIL